MTRSRGSSYSVLERLNVAKSVLDVALISQKVSSELRLSLLSAPPAPLGWWLYDMQRHSSNLNYHVESVNYQVSALSDYTKILFPIITSICLCGSMLTSCWLGKFYCPWSIFPLCRGMCLAWRNLERTGGQNVSMSLHPTNPERTNSVGVWEVEYLLRIRHLTVAHCHASLTLLWTNFWTSIWQCLS